MVEYCGECSFWISKSTSKYNPNITFGVCKLHPDIIVENDCRMWFNEIYKDCKNIDNNELKEENNG